MNYDAAYGWMIVLSVLMIIVGASALFGLWGLGGSLIAFGLLFLIATAKLIERHR